MTASSLIRMLAAAFLASACCSTSETNVYEGVPFEMPRVQLPSIPSRSVCLTDFGAVGDGVTLNTEAFAKAIDHLAGLGGGRLEVPAGIWLTGPIGLQSHIELHLDQDAVIVFSTDQSLYPIIDTNFEGLDVRRCLSPLHAEGATDIAITGKGVIDGNGDPWREVKRRKVGDDTWKTILKRGVTAVGMGSKLFPKEVVKAGDWKAISDLCAKSLAWFKK